MEDYSVRYRSPWVMLRRNLVPLIVIVVALVGVYFWHTGQLQAAFKGRVANKVELPNVGQIGGRQYVKATSDVQKEALPMGDELAGKVWATINIYDWHGNTAMLYANGGERTIEGSFFGREGLIVKIAKQDDTNITIKDFIDKRAVEWKNSGGRSGGNLMFTIMGNASVALLEPVNKALKAIDPSYRLVAIDLVGKSDGEDQIIGPVEWKTNPEAMRGKTCVGVYDDGDIALAFQLADKVGVPVNFDYRTHNPSALNIENVSEFIQAGKVFIANRPLDSRPVVDDSGKRTGKTTADIGTRLMLDCVASWTPVDRNIYMALQKSDPARLKRLATITSTGQGEERKVMPTVLVVFKPWADANRDKLVKFSYAVHKAALQLDKYPDALTKAMEYATAVLGVWDGVDEKKSTEERVRAFHGYTPPENRNLRIGGSAVFSFQDAMRMLGMDDRGDDLANSTFASVYRSFGNLTVRKFPEKEITSFAPFEQFFDPTILRAAYERAKNEDPRLAGVQTVATRDYTKGAGPAIGSASYYITYRTGSAELTPAGIETLREIMDKYGPDEHPLTFVGHADRTGTDAINVPLSRARAETAKAYLVRTNSRDFPSDRIDTDGRGSSEPPKSVNPNYTGVCDQCRRVEIVISR